MAGHSRRACSPRAPQTFFLSDNYRSTELIVATTQHLISLNAGREQAPQRALRPGGEKIEVSSRAHPCTAARGCAALVDGFAALLHSCRLPSEAPAGFATLPLVRAVLESSALLRFCLQVHEFSDAQTEARFIADSIEQLLQ